MAIVAGEGGEIIGNPYAHLRLGDCAQALRVHFEPDGILRLSNEPAQAIECEHGLTAAGRRVIVWHNSCEDHQKFVMGNDGTLAPEGNGDVVWGLRGEDVVLVARDDPWAQVLLFDEGAGARVKGRTTWTEATPPACANGYVLELASHPAQALSLVAGGALGIVPVASASRLLVGGDQLIDLDSGRRIALGTRSTAML